MRTGRHNHHLMMSQEKTTPVSPGEPVQFSGQSFSCTREGSVDRSKLVATSGGAPPALGSRQTRHAAAVPHQAGKFNPRLEAHTTFGSCRARHAASLTRGALDLGSQVSLVVKALVVHVTSMAGSGTCTRVIISGAWARGYPQISGAYDPGYSSGDLLGHMPRISAGIPGACSKSSRKVW